MRVSWVTGNASHAPAVKFREVAAASWQVRPMYFLKLRFILCCYVGVSSVLASHRGGGCLPAFSRPTGNVFD